MGAFMENGKNILLTYVTIPDVNWKLILRMDIDELEEPVQAAGVKLAGICIAALLVGAAIIWIFVMSISK